MLMNQYSMPTEFKRRPAFNTTGKSIQLAVNAYRVIQFPNVTIYQYDVIIGTGAEKRVVQRKVWESKARKDRTGTQIIYDGNKLAWSTRDYGELRITVDLDAEEGRPSRGDRNTFRLHIKRTRQIDVGIIDQFLQGRIQMSVQVAEAINFMDHLLREGPASNPRFVTVRRSFFIRDGQRADLGGGVEVFRGIYQSMRLAEGQKLIVNLDVANTCFWKPTALTTAIMANKKLRDVPGIIKAMRPVQDNGTRKLSPVGKIVSNTFKGVVVKAVYPGNPTANKDWKIAKFDVNNANEERIEWKDPVTKEPTGEKVTIALYFRRKYNLTLQYPQLPLVEMTKKGVKYPLELVHIIQNQRYTTKLDDTQTANMIKFAVSPPSVRLSAIREGKSWLNWENDEYLKTYGLRIDDDTIKTNAQLLPPPSIKFGKGAAENPQTRGRWDLRGKRFFSTNPRELVAWGVGFFPGRIKADKAAIDKFCMDFARAYRNHDGKVASGLPNVMLLPSDPGHAVEALHQSTGNKFNRRPQLLVFLVQDKNAFHYLRIKKSCDCRYGVVSQVMQVAQVLKGNPQYYSNVLMKVNAKLGGCTSQVLPHPTSGFKSFGVPTMIIGADVSHASPGSSQPSMAAITVSFDRHAGRYAAGCQTNSHRVEMISETNMHSLLTPLISQWRSQVGGGTLPTQVYYMRDGVSEGQFAHVMNQEVPHIKAVLDKISGKPWDGKITVIIASKRHHIRAFPRPGGDAADQRGNPLPGCLIERDVTMPNEWDFYLYSHTALQGTSRPVHYTILHDDAGHSPSAIQNMIYEHCYQYMRSTTSVSLHPAVYYAHLASNRAKAHQDIASSEGPQAGPGFKQNAPSSSDQVESEPKSLLEMYDGNGIPFAMWYI